MKVNRSSMLRNKTCEAYKSPMVRVSMVRQSVAEFGFPVTSNSEACVIAKEHFDSMNYDREVLVVFSLDTKLRVIAMTEASIGTIDASLVHPREVFKVPIIVGAQAIIVAHNHPSGDSAPSIADKRVHDRLKECGKLLGIEVLDHIVVGDEAYSIERGY